MTEVKTSAIRIQASLIVSPRASASTPKATAPSTEMTIQIAVCAARTRRKLRRRLPIFKFEHRFERLEPPLPFVSLVGEWARRDGARRAGAPANAAANPRLQRQGRQRDRRRHW